MMHKKYPGPAIQCVFSVLVSTLGAVTAGFAQQNPFMTAGTGQPAPPPTPPPSAAAAQTVPSGTNTTAASASEPLDKFFNHWIPDAIAAGRINLNVRLRYEQVDDDGIGSIKKNSYVPTVRTRFGYTTASFYGFQAMVEGVNVSVLGPEHNYNAGGSNHQGDRPAVGDPPLTRLDQGWLGYTYTNWVSAKVGEQHIALDNHRFIGDVGWRQNMQTFDGASVASEPLDGLNLYYAYVWDVHRVFGDVSGLPAANTDFDSHSDFVNFSYSGWKYGQFTAYAYLLDLRNGAGDANSCATYGGYFAGAAPVCDKMSVDYRAEFAWQTDYADSPLRYDACYYNLEAGADIDPLAFGGGYEDLGSGANTGKGGGRAAFRTPLATLHSFNGWAEVFLTTPSAGLRDLYAYAQVTLPWQIPVRVVYHKFDPDSGHGNYGQEIDAVVSRKLGKYWTALVEFANYIGEDAAPPSLAAANVTVQRVWAQIQFDF